jgi:hypothetical protein
MQDENGDLVKVRVAGVPDSGQNLDDAANWGDVQSYAAVVSVSFDGGSAPAAGVNTGKFLICHTAGGGYSAGDIVYDDGSSLVPVVNCKFIGTLVEVTGDIDLPQYGWFVNDGGTWTSLTNSGSSPIKIDFDFTDTSELVSNQQVPDGAIISRQQLVITTAFDGAAPTVSATLKGTPAVELMAAGQFKVKRARQYPDDTLTIVGTGEGGNVGLTVTPSTATQGEGYYLVWFDIPKS